MIGMLKKICSKCKKEKLYSDFYKDKRGKDGLYSACKECCENARKVYYKKHKAYYKEYRDSPQYKKYQQGYRMEHRGEHSEEQRSYFRNYWRRRRLNPMYNLDSNMGHSISICLKGKKAGRTWEKLVHYTKEDLMKHLENQFDDKMSWDNYGSYWWVDHIKPRSLFKYKVPEDEEFQKCWALENLQPLEKIANMKKSNHYQGN